jgi:heme/copper-type cytochrome/quinol oxidase subunit 3
MGIHTSRTADPLPDARPGATMGTWGLWLTIVVLAMFVAGIAAAALYLHTGQPEWPPEGITAPPRTRAVLAAVLVAIGAAFGSVALPRIRTGDRAHSALLLAMSLVVVTASVIVLVQDLAASGFRWDEHAYTSVYWVLTGTSMTFAGVGVVVIGAVMVQMSVGLIDDERHLELTNATIYLWFAAGTTVVLLALVHLLPEATRGVS